MTRITKKVGRFGEFHIEFVTNLPSFQKVGKVWWNRIHIDCFFFVTDESFGDLLRRICFAG